MTTLSSRQVDIDDLKRVHLLKGDALWLRVRVGKISHVQMIKYFDALRQSLQGVFPNNKIIVTADDIDMSVITTLEATDVSNPVFPRA